MVINAKIPYPTNCPQPQKPGAILNTSNNISDNNIDAKGNIKAKRLSLKIAPAKIAIPTIGLKLCGYINTLDIAAANINKTAIMIEVLFCFCIVLLFVQK